jgi:hypothetical protein
VFCALHVKRNFAKKWPQHPIRHELPERLWTAESKTELLGRMASICQEYPELTTWIRSKQALWIISGLTKGESKVPFEYWIYARKHTGISESSHFKDNNFAGRKTSLLNAILK